MKNDIQELLKLIDSKAEYYKSFSNYEHKVGTAKNADVLYSRYEECQFVISELQRIINKNS